MSAARIADKTYYPVETPALEHVRSRETVVAMIEYTWDKTDGTAETTLLTPEIIPTRVALTATAVVTSAEPTPRTLLVDPHPRGTWETWMFPYSSLTLQKDVIRERMKNLEDLPLFLLLTPNNTLADVAKALDELFALYHDEYRQALTENMNNVLPNLVQDWNGEPFYLSYSLKYSNTSNSYTAYRFSYYQRVTTETELAVDHLWVNPNDLTDPANAPKQINNKDIAESVTIVLRQMPHQGGEANS